MAEFVQQSIEEMLPELEQMQRVGLFSAREARSILRKRKSYEYKLRRRTKEKSDFLLYIQYEINVLALVRKRREKTGYKFKRVEIDVAIVQRIHKLFKLACFRFQDDVKLWLSHIEFCKNRHEKTTVSKVYSRMLQVHSRRPELWVSAAQWEVTENNSMETGRSLLQRGLRFNTNSKHLWQEYFRMELINAEKMQQRQQILGITEVQEDGSAMPNAILQGAIAEIVYRKAVEAMPEDVNFLVSLVKICSEFPFTQKLQDTMYQQLMADHGSSEVAWDTLAQRPLTTAQGPQKRSAEENEAEDLACCQVYESATQKLPTESMWSCYITFCIERLGQMSNKRTKRQRLERCKAVLQQAAQQSCVSEPMYMQWIELLEGSGDPQGAINVALAGTGSHRRSAALWARYLGLLISLQHTDSLQPLIEEALKAVPERESLAVWQVALQWMCLQQPAMVEPLFERGVSCCAEVSGPLKLHYLDWCALHKDVASVRSLFLRLSTTKPITKEFFDRYVEIENSQAEPKMKHLRVAMETACKEFCNDPDVWLDYMHLELSHRKGRPENVGQLYWRAMKSLDGSNVDHFLTKYSLIRSS